MTSSLTAPGGSRQKGGSVKDEHILRPLARIEGKLDLLISATGAVLRKESRIMGIEQDILLECQRTKDIQESARLLMQRLYDLVAAGDPESLQQALAILKNEDDATATAVVNYTPAA